MANQPVQQDKDFVQSLARGLSIIVCLTGAGQGLTLTEVANKAGLTRAAARRFLLTLVKIGYVDMQGKEFSLTPKILELGYTYISSMPIAELSGPYLDALVQTLNESCSISVLHARDVVHIARRKATNRVLSLNIHVGSRLPIHATSMGRVLLSGMDMETRQELAQALEYPAYTEHTIASAAKLLDRVSLVEKRGWDIAENEREHGLISASVPIINRVGQITACLNVSAHTSSTNVSQMQSTIIPEMIKVRDELAAVLNSLS